WVRARPALELGHVGRSTAAVAGQRRRRVRQPGKRIEQQLDALFGRMRTKITETDRVARRSAGRPVSRTCSVHAVNMTQSYRRNQYSAAIDAELLRQFACSA